MRTVASPISLVTGAMLSSKRSPSASSTISVGRAAGSPVGSRGKCWESVFTGAPWRLEDGLRVDLGRGSGVGLLGQRVADGWRLVHPVAVVQAAKRRGGPPVGVAEQRHGGGDEQAAHQRCVDRDGDREREAHLLDAEA